VTEPTVFAIAHEQVLDQACRHPRELVTNLIALQTLILRDVASIASDFQSRTHFGRRRLRCEEVFCERPAGWLSESLCDIGRGDR
jgi:hypothetical protein